MAKKRRVNSSPPSSDDGNPLADGDREQVSPLFSPLSIAAALLAGALVYVTYHPSDSVAVERGDALWFGMIALAIATVTMASAMRGRFASDVDRFAKWSWSVDVIAVLLAAWMMLAAFATSPPGNLRMATNEAWLWISGVAVFCSSRRLLVSVAARRAVVTLIIVCSIGVSVHGLHQHWVSLPQSRAQYRADPDKLLGQAGIVAPAGSAERMVFENRLFDGGPTGTFALANSLAGLLVVGCVLITGVLRMRWPTMTSAIRAAWLIALLIGWLCLWAARSRSATAACVLGMIAVAIGASLLSNTDSGQNLEKQTARRGRLRLVFSGLAALVAAGVGIVSLIAAVGNKEWFEQAPQSIAFRFQYWRSTWQMALDGPLFAAGPGNFQSIYQRYREESANEEIADAHNFLFETLAAGGFVGLLLLIGLLSASAWLIYGRLSKSPSDVDRPDDRDDSQSDDAAKWVWLGGGLSLLMVWLIGAAAGQMPDFEAHKFAVPVAVAAAWLLWPTVKKCSASGIDLIVLVAMGALMIHLLAAGGWTVPGVAMSIWLFAGMLTRVDSASEKSSGEKNNWTPTLAAVLVGVALLTALRIMSLGPVEAAAVAIRKADYARSQNQLAAMNQAVDRAIAADPWSGEAAMHKADLLHWELILRGDQSSLQTQWKAQVVDAYDRAGENPSIYRAGGLQSLHLYQRFGADEYLRLAGDWLDQASRWSPVDLSLLAQRSIIADRQGDRDLALQLAARSARLSLLGSNAERSLSRQMIYVAAPIGRSVADGPEIRSASELLRDLLNASNTANQTSTGTVPK